MKIQVLSDLHLEFGAMAPPLQHGDVVVLAGDIAEGTDGLQWALETFTAPVVYVLGNHEFYGHDVRLVDRLKASAAGTHVRVLECDAVEIDGVHFLGTTLWTDFGLYGPDLRDSIIARADAVLRDFRVITKDGERFSAALSRDEHLHSRAWLIGALDALPAGKPVVVVTHHAPHPGSLVERFRTDPISAAFVSNLEASMGRPDVWIHGHTHASFAYSIAGTRVVCNAKGYPNAQAPERLENPRFDPELCVDVAPPSSGDPSRSS